VNAGFHSSGNQILYNGTTGEQIYSEIFMGPNYYMRLKQLVKDKINYRARGPRTMLTRQTVQGRANDGGLRIGEMERDGIMAHGASAFLNDAYMNRGDEYYMAVCNKTGCIAIYNPSINLFLSPFVDGPIKFTDTLDGKKNIDNVSRFGRSFSIVRIPYALKLLMQELQVMNVQMRIITEDNIDQLMSMSYSDNIYKLLKQENDGKLVETVEKYKKDIIMGMNKIRIEETKKPKKQEEENELPDFEEKYKDEKRVKLKFKDPAKLAEYEALPLKDQLLFEKYVLRMKQLKEEETPSDKTVSEESPSSQNIESENSYIINGKFSTETPPDYNQGNTPQYNPNSPEYAPGSPAYFPETPPDYNQGNTPQYNPNSPSYPSGSSEEDIKPITSDNILELKEEKKKEEKEQSGGNGTVKKIISFDLKPDIIKLP
jgi:hypothetical protein